MFKYIKVAFKNRWNLLALAGSVGAAFISGYPEIVLPVVLAVETAYLGFVGTHPKFQKYIDVQEAQAKRAVHSQHNEAILERIRQGLPHELLSRFNRLRTRCQHLRELASNLKHPGYSEVGSSLDSAQIAGLDRLLWVFLRLLFTYHSLETFLRDTSLEGMQNDKSRLEQRLSEIGDSDQSQRAQKLRHAIGDNLQTLQDRIDNYHRAEENYEFVGLEIDRLENKIKSLAELAVNRQEPDFITDEVDRVADSMKHTEQTMNDLQFATGLGRIDEVAPELLREQEVYEIQ